MRQTEGEIVQNRREEKKHYSGMNFCKGNVLEGAWNLEVERRWKVKENKEVVHDDVIEWMKEEKLEFKSAAICMFTFMILKEAQILLSHLKLSH